MNYALAKELKDAGFPQGALLLHDSKFYLNDGEVIADWNTFQQLRRPNGHILSKNDLVCIPTLEELIEACGDGFQNLYRVNGHVWQTNFVDGFAGETAGSTPTEAVARLWLALNKKETV